MKGKRRISWLSVLLIVIPTSLFMSAVFYQAAGWHVIWLLPVFILFAGRPVTDSNRWVWHKKSL